LELIQLDSSNTSVYKIELLTPEGKYNYVAYLLADENGVSIKVSKYVETDKVDLIENEEYGYCSLIKATYQVLDKLKVENTTLAKITSSKRLEKNLVEPIPMREAIINAIMRMVKNIVFLTRLGCKPCLCHILMFPSVTHTILQTKDKNNFNNHSN
jgi:hypothetical protein